MLHTDQASLICPRNDLESQTILTLAARLGLDAREVAGDWGLTLDEALRQHPDLESLRAHVIVVELPGTDGLERLQAVGKQVHVVDHHGPPGQGAQPSSLEQFARLIGYRLTPAEYEVAIADRDFYPGLSRAGVPFARAQALRQEESMVRGDTHLVEAARRFVASYPPRRLGQCVLYLAPERFANVLLEAAQTPAEDAYTEAAARHQPVGLPQVLAVFHADDDPGAIRGVRFAGQAAHRPALATLLDDPDLRDGLDLWLGGGTLGCFFGARARTGYPAPPFDRLVSRLFALIGGTARPLLHYGCTFLLPLDLHEDSELAQDPSRRAERFGRCLERKAEAGEILPHRLAVAPPRALLGGGDRERRCETQAYLYFLPLLRDLLYDTDRTGRTGPPPAAEAPSPIQRWRLPPQDLRWRLAGSAGIGPPLDAAIRDVSLYRYHNALYVLAIQVEPADQVMQIDGAEELICDGDRWWHPLFYSDPKAFERIERLRLDHWLRFTKHARILYPSFIEQVDENKFEAQELIASGKSIARFAGGDDVSPIVFHLLSRFLTDDADRGDPSEVLKHLLRLQNLSEERMFVNVVYGLAGPAPTQPAEQAEADRLFSLALYVDREADTWSAAGGYAYDPDYTRTLIGETHRLDRWRALGTYLGFCPYANAYLGFGGFFARVIAAEHVPYHYERMLILALFYQLTLRNFNRRITHATSILVQAPRADPGSCFRELRRQFIEFTNRYWFREVTLAIQGKEVFARQIRAMDIQPEYDEVKDEMERADEYVQSLQGQALNERVFQAALIALGLTLLTLVLPLIEYDKPVQYRWWGVLAAGSALLAAFSFRRLRTKRRKPRK